MVSSWGGDAGAKLQFSFDFRLFGRDDGPRLDFRLHSRRFPGRSTVRRGRSAPPATARNCLADVPVGANAVFGGGYRHDSNGGGVTNSIDINRVFVRAAKAFDLGDGWRVDLDANGVVLFRRPGYRAGHGPLLGLYLARRVVPGQRNGIKLAITARQSALARFGRGLSPGFHCWRGSADALPCIIFGQAYIPAMA